MEFDEKPGLDKDIDGVEPENIHEKHEELDSILQEVHEQLRFLHSQVDS
jgi:hypothetical protein